MESLKHDSDILDLAVIGGGPAGTAAALEARRNGLQVGIWEQDHFPRDKVCGEFISSEAMPLLQRETPRTMARGAVIRCAEFISSNGSVRAFRLPSSAMGVSRRLLDASLWETAEAAGIKAHQKERIRRVRKLVHGYKQVNVWEIESDNGCTCCAKALIIACGRWWRIEGFPSPACQAGSAKPGDWIGAKAHFANIPSRGKVEMYFFRGGYCGLAPVEDGAYNVCCLVRRDRIRDCGAEGMKDFAAWLARMSCHSVLETRMRGAVQVSPVVSTAPVFLVRGQAVQSGALLVGDASGFLDPFTGEGISMALHTGRLAARAIAKSMSEELGDEQLAQIYEKNLAHAVRRSYMISAVARGLMFGPAWLQGLVTAALPRIGKSLLRETRWRGDQRVNLT